MRPITRYSILLLLLAMLFPATGYGDDIERIMKKARQGNANAQNNLGLIYQNGEGVEEDDEKAVYWFRKAAERGNASARYNLGERYRNGEGVEQDFKKAAYWFKMAAYRGSSHQSHSLGAQNARNSLGEMLMNGEATPRYERSEARSDAFNLFRRAARAGHSKAQYNLGWGLKYGKIVNKYYQNNYDATYWFKKAFNSYKKEAERGDAFAKFSLGEMYENGEGVEQDAKKSVYWYRKSAEQGYAKAQSRLGKMYKKGKGVSQSDEQASIWYVKAAIQGHTEAQNNLQSMHGDDINKLMKKIHRDGGRLTQQKRFSLGGVITKESKAGRNSTKRKVSNADMVATAREYEKAIRTILEIGPIPTPSLPSLQKYEQNVFENQEEFKARIAEVRDARKRQIEAIQRDYRKQVEARNQRVKDYDVKRDFYRNLAIALAVEKLYGTPVLYPTTKAQDKPNYDAESRTFSMALVFSEGSDFKRNISSVFPDNQSAESFYKKLGEGDTLPLQVNFHIDTKGNIELEQVAFDWQSATIAGSAAKTITDNSSDKLTVVLGQRDQVRSMLQNPVIPDKEFDVWLAQEQKEFDDDIPQLLKRHKQAKVDKRKWLFVIGAGEYKETSNILYSRRSAELFAQVASKILGIDPSRSVVLLDKDATSGSIEGQLKGMLRKVKGGDTLYFYYSGHGVPVLTKGYTPYMLATDHVPDFIHENSYFRLENIYQSLSTSGAKVVAFVDSCFSGRTDNESVFGSDKGAVRLKPKELSISTDGPLAVITAGSGKQFSNALPSRGHRLFSYYLMKAMLEGHTKVSTLYDNVSSEVHKESLNLGGLKEQKPVLQGNRNLTL